MATVSKKVLNQFLEREREDYRRFKRLKVSELNKIAAKLPIRPPIWDKLRKHQKVCFLIGVQTNRFGFWMDTGTGKTLLTIALVRYFKKLGQVRRMLILVPQRSHKAEWARELRKHTPHTSFTVLNGSSEKKWQQLRSSQAVFTIVTYMGLNRMVSELKPDKKRPSKNRLVPVKKLVTELTKTFDGYAADESIALASKSNLAFRVCRQLSKTAKVVFELNATPFGKTPEHLWGQMFLLDGGYTLGENLKIWRAAFCTKKKDEWSGFYKYTFEKCKAVKLRRFIAHRSIRYQADEADLPKLNHIVRQVTLSKDAHSLYEEQKAKLIAAHGNYEEMKNNFIRMRQISSGWVGYVDDELGARAQYDFKPNPKLDYLMWDIKSVHEEHKFIVYHDFVFSGSIVCRELDAAGVGHVRLDGRTKNIEEVLDQFDNDPSVRGIVLNNFLGSTGLNLQRARYGLYFERPTNPVLMYQGPRRFRRQYSDYKSVFMIDYVARGTYDQEIVDNHNENKDLFQEIIGDVSSSLE